MSPMQLNACTRLTVLGTLFYSALLFGGFALLRRKLPALRAQTV